MERNSEFWAVWAARPVMKVSAILLKYATFEGIYFGLDRLKSGILRSECTSEGALNAGLGAVKIKFAQLDFTNLIFQKSSADQ